MLEELEKGHNVPVTDVVKFIRELDGKVRFKKESSKEIERELRKTLELNSGTFSFCSLCSQTI